MSMPMPDTDTPLPQAGLELAKGLRVVWNFESAMAFRILESPDSLLLLTPATVTGPEGYVGPKLPSDNFFSLSDAF